jgi:hypothetical protein
MEGESQFSGFVAPLAVQTWMCTSVRTKAR